MKILVTYDGSEASREAFDEAARLARETGGELLLLRVHRAPTPAWVNPNAEARERELAALQAEWDADIEAAAAEVAAAHGVTVRGMAHMLGQRWSESAEILTTAEQEGVDLICMATHGETGIRSFFVGSTAQAVVAESVRPVLLVRAGRDKQ